MKYDVIGIGPIPLQGPILQAIIRSYVNCHWHFVCYNPNSCVLTTTSFHISRHQCWESKRCKTRFTQCLVRKDRPWRQCRNERSMGVFSGVMCSGLNNECSVTRETIRQWFSRVTSSLVKIIAESHHSWQNFLFTITYTSFYIPLLQCAC